MSLSARLAGAADDARIRALLRELAMPGPMSLAFTREPDFFAALRAEGREARVVLVEDGERLVGLGVGTAKPVFLDGRPARVGYLSTLRMRPEGRASGAVLRGYRHFGELEREGATVPFHLTCIVEENLAARRLLEGRRRGMPEYRELGRLRTFVLPVPRRARRRARGEQARGGVRIVAGDQVGAAGLFAFLRAHGATRQLYPVYADDELSRPDGLLPGLRLADFDAALVGDEIRGVLATWDQAALRQSVVAGYAGWLRALAPLSRAAARLLPVPPLPRPGTAVAAAYAACVAVAGERPEVLGALLESALARLAGSGKSFLLLGLPVGDPLEAALAGRPRLTLASRYYAVRWGAGEPPALDRRPHYLELGSL